MFIGKTVRGYVGSEQIVRSAPFLILVSLGMIEHEEICQRCSGFTRYVANAEEGPEYARVVPCAYCKRAKCGACEGRGYLVDASGDALQCSTCHGKGDTGGTGKVTRYEHSKEIRALVRNVALRQCGHWMMGSARAFGARISISGTYGGDGLPVTVPREVFDRAVPIPAELHAAWNTGGGWNGAGSEAPMMVEWARAHLSELSSARRK